MILALRLLAALAVGAPAQISSPTPPAVYSLAQSFNEAYETPIKADLLGQIRRTPPVSARDVEALFDLFSHFGDDSVRHAVVDSLDLMDPQAYYLEPIFLALLKQREPEAVFFGIRGALKIHSPNALPLIEKLAHKKLPFDDPSQTPLMSKRNAWWNQYEAMDALAQWKPEEVHALLLERSRKAPKLARILAKSFFKETVPLLPRWSVGDAADQARAQEALGTPISLDSLRRARPEMLQILRDGKSQNSLRYQIAIKIGVSAQESDVTALLKEFDALSDPKDKLYFETALFATESPQIAPLLLAYSKENPSASERAGARAKLKKLLDAPRYRELIAWAAANDPDAQSRQDAAKELAAQDKTKPARSQ